MTSPKPTPEGSDVFAVQEDQYKFGLGPILVRGVAVICGIVFDDAQWWTIQAEVAAGTPDNHGKWIQRDIYVTDSTLMRILRRE